MGAVEHAVRLQVAGAAEADATHTGGATITTAAAAAAAIAATSSSNGGVREC